MEIFVSFEAFDTITEPSEIQALRAQIGERMQRIEKSGALVDARVFSDARGGYMLLDVQDSDQLFELLGPELLDHAHIETHPVVTLETLARFFQREAAPDIDIVA